MDVPAGPGGPTDVLARLVAEHGGGARPERDHRQSRRRRRRDRRQGGGGADPDGYTLLFGNTATLANIPAVYAGYDPSRISPPSPDGLLHDPGKGRMRR